MFRRRSKQTAIEELDMMLENAELKIALKEARQTISLLLNARLPEVVHPKRMVRECINPTLLKRAFAAINPRKEG